MRRLSALIGKSIVNRDTGERIGKSADVLVSHDGSRVVGVVVGGGMLSGEAGVLPLEQVQSFGGDVIISTGERPLVDVDGWRARAPETIRSSTLAQRRLVTRAGEDLGAIRDVCIDERGVVRGYEVADSGFAGLVQQHRLVEPTGGAVIGPDVVLVDRVEDSAGAAPSPDAVGPVFTSSPGTAAPAARPSPQPGTSPANPIPGQPVEPRT
jgi:uncharacterized protein YrrD